MLLTIPVPGAALTTNSTRPKKILKFVHMVGASWRLAKVSSAPFWVKGIVAPDARVQSGGVDLALVKSTK